MQLPVSLGRIPGSMSDLSVYEQVYNSSIFSVYLPIANEADFKNAYSDRKYGIDFYHTLLMTNHMESDPDEFAEGIRGRTLWHNEYRSQKMYMSQSKFGDRTFAAAFDPQTAPAPFHNNTCDGCHVRNGSGIPINPALTLPVDGSGSPIQQFMTAAAYNPCGTPGDEIKDYTFTGKIRPMKLVFFDLKRSTSGSDDSVYSKPLAASQVAQAPSASAVKTAESYYKKTIMNFYGDSFHVTRPGYSYSCSYGPAKSNRMVVNTPRVNSELANNCGMTCATYQPLQVNLGTFLTDQSCKLFQPKPTPPNWPATCNDINSTAIHMATDEQTAPSVGFMLLNGKRLGNLGAIEAIPTKAIQGFQKSQSDALGSTIAGEVQYQAGSRDGVGGPYSLVKECQTKSPNNCYIGRFGWLGDRVSLEDQVANAAFVEMNMTTKTGYGKVNANVAFPIRYDRPNCGPADQTCKDSGGNGDLLEKDINRMAAYARWLGDPTRSEFMASLPDVIAGENIFVQIKCNTCHVRDLIEITDPNTMLTKYFRDRLAKRVDNSNKVYPFLSYLGTDLLMHDMGYLSQVGNASGSIRDPNGVVLSRFKDYVQKIRTPPLKGLRFNRFVTDSQKNTKKLCNLDPKTDTCDPACDFLLHDGRACDAIEAAFLHDGPAIKKLGVINGISGCVKNSGNECGLNDLTPTQLQQLRAFLYSL
jgi:Di-haem oxidoreductase, putative peroxidase